MRLFTAVYPSAEASAHLDLAVGGVGGAAVPDPGAGLRWVPRAQRHVTLVFHGTVPDGALPGYVATLREALAQVEPFPLSLAGSGTFGGRTLWVGLRDDVPALRRLGALASDVAAGEGMPARERSGGRPHVTVARASTVRGGERRQARRERRAPEPAAPFAQWARALAVYSGPAWTVERVHVVASELGAGRSGGPAHTDVAALPLGQAVDG
ncbi:RNA 2',3'-cyclic phosphodiesterase [Isoptericola halotolerans]|uniref:RNA 2',3'-cyclic phosphodiesterase n=1 Tax=Isoptericola halotolerans TaxID=300560 RepID=UPI00388D61AE